jgi:hypothetical protein
MNRRTSISALLLIPAAATLKQATAQTAARLTKKELRDLLMSAKTKVDHQRIADHYRAEVDRLNGEAKEHEEMAVMYRQHPPLLAAKHPWAVGEKHCRGVAERLRQAAEKAKALVAMHEAMAKAA